MYLSDIISTFLAKTCVHVCPFKSTTLAATPVTLAYPVEPFCPSVEFSGLPLVHPTQVEMSLI